ncbi:MAG: potassium transporter TrkG, partial [Kiritimatiellae bacterium]|nr:potassium transporter TrkG [Kiritimatiellia bacterium]
AILPFLGMGGMQLYRAEMAGPSKDRLAPRIATTAKLLWGVYILLILLESVLLRVAGMDWFDAVCHSMATVASGGFSTRTDSIAAFNSRSIEAIIMVFMFLAGVNFALHYRVLLGEVKSYFKNTECRFYMGWMLLCVFVVTFLLFFSETYDSFGASFRYGCFQVLSIGSTTGFVTADFDLWPKACILLLLLLMLFGACAGSTSGAVKNIRVVVIFKKIKREIKLFMQPQAVFRIKVNDEPLEQDVISNITAFVIAYMLVFILGSLVMTFFSPDILTSCSAVAATLGGVGPGMSMAGPMENYAAFSGAGKAVLIICMLLGRLELYSVLVLLLPSFWKK